jgi:polysaccharide pyruvyl transferase WcaK-like protein
LVLELPPGIPADVPGLWEGYAEWLGSKGVSRPRVAIHGGYGKNNLGDDAILDVLLARTLGRFPDADVTVVCHGPENVKARYRDLPSLSACHFKSLGALRAVVGSHLYFIGGGGIINRINVYSGRQRLRLLDMKGKYLFLAALGAKLSGARTHFYAIGATSFPDAGVKLLAQWGLRHADIVSVRDPMSLDNLRALGVDRDIVLVRDPAVALTPAPKEAAERLLSRWNAGAGGRPRACLGFRYVREPDISNEAKVDRVAALARHLMHSGLQVVFLAASQHPSEHFEDDLHFGRAVRSRLGHAAGFALIEEYCHPRLTMAALGCMDLCVLERLHAVILASMAGRRVYAISYDNKVSEFVKLAGQERCLMGLRDFMQQPSFDWLDSHLDGLRVSPGAS